MADTGHTVHIEFPSVFEMIDLVQALVDQLGRMLGFDEDAQHWVGVAVRESVINAIKHGNRHDPSKQVDVEFTMTPGAAPTELLRARARPRRRVRPGALPDPLAPENILKASGRGIFFMRSFMDDVRIERAPGGGMEVRMVKRLSRPVTDPLFLATAVEAVLRAGDIQMAHLGASIEVSKKGAIDLVTEVDIAVERMFRAMIAERFPDHAVLAEELGSAGQREGRCCWIFDPLDGTTNYAHGLPIFASSLALEIDGVVTVGAIYDPTRQGAVHRHASAAART